MQSELSENTKVRIDLRTAIIIVITLIPATVAATLSYANLTERVKKVEANTEKVMTQHDTMRKELGERLSAIEGILKLREQVSLQEGVLSKR